MSGNARYYVVMSGLRGCYTPDISYPVRVTTRRELKTCIAAEAASQSCDGAFSGLSKSQVTWAAAHAWTAGEAILPFGLPRGSKPFAIEISRISWREFKEHNHDQT